MSWLPLRDMNLKENYTIENRELNVILLGEINSNFDITFKVKNLFFMGKIVCSNKVTFDSTEDYFSFRTLKAKELILKANTLHKSEDSKELKLSEKALFQKLNELGVD